jgi:uncharacterized protein YqgC (DUF456 family)
MFELIPPELIAIMLMVLALFLIMIPAVPVTVLEWAIAIVYGATNAFTRLNLWAAAIVTLLMIAGITSSLWMPFLGLRGRKISCLAMTAFFVGMFLGTAIPIPIFGNFLGGAIAVFIVEYLQSGGDTDHALKTGEAAFTVIVMSMLVEFLMAAAIVLVTGISMLLTIPPVQ